MKLQLRISYTLKNLDTYGLSWKLIFIIIETNNVIIYIYFIVEYLPFIKGMSNIVHACSEMG